MSLRIFNALSASGIQQPSVRYPWDDWRENRDLRAADQTVVARLNEISRRAVLAYACGSAEWMVYRFTGLTDTQKAWDFLEASWAMIVHLRYGTGAESWSFAAEEGWEGPVRDPIRRCLEYLEAAIYSAYSDDDIEPAVRASKIVKLVMYVMPNPGPYQEWSERILTRLEALYRRDPADPLGDPVPRDAVDPEVEFRLTDAEPLLNQFLSGLDYRTNQFLRPPEEMGELIEGEDEFRGTPYLFSMEQDRSTRRAR